MLFPTTLERLKILNNVQWQSSFFSMLMSWELNCHTHIPLIYRLLEWNIIIDLVVKLCLCVCVKISWYTVAHRLLVQCHSTLQSQFPSHQTVNSKWYDIWNMDYWAAPEQRTVSVIHWRQHLTGFIKTTRGHWFASLCHCRY